MWYFIISQAYRLKYKVNNTVQPFFGVNFHFGELFQQSWKILWSQFVENTANSFDKYLQDCISIWSPWYPCFMECYILQEWTNKNDPGQAPVRFHRVSLYLINFFFTSEISNVAILLIRVRIFMNVNRIALHVLYF